MLCSHQTALAHPTCTISYYVWCHGIVGFSSILRVGGKVTHAGLARVNLISMLDARLTLPAPPNSCIGSRHACNVKFNVR